jgi:hypothetical protein
MLALANRLVISQRLCAATALAVTLAACSGHSSSSSPLPAAGANPAQAAADLLAADRAFSDSAASGSVVNGFARMFAPDVQLIAGARITNGRDSAAAMLSTNPVNVASSARWWPVRVGVSADGTHGFSLGYMDVSKGDSVVARAKYIAYWVRRDGQWRVLAYKRNVRPPGTFSRTVLPPSLPTGSVPHKSSAEHVAELRAIEVAFSDSGKRDLPAAFRFFAAPDANHFGGPNDVEYLTGPDAIARGIRGDGAPGPQIAWAPSVTFVSPAGDLGVNAGFISFIENGTARQGGPFMTIWRRTPGGVWRYIAE